MTVTIFVSLFVLWVLVFLQTIMMCTILGAYRGEMKSVSYRWKLVVAFFWPVTLFYFLYKELQRDE